MEPKHLSRFTVQLSKNKIEIRLSFGTAALSSKHFVSSAQITLVHNQFKCEEAVIVVVF